MVIDSFTAVVLRMGGTLGRGSEMFLQGERIGRP
jgi:hypothetical protein